ncbi:MAG TPA: DUF1015 family protein [Methylomusa anaerophila]|uniref:DUF1015 domain-containing protein n=1 Tax=Methylomusa anaerophila TaxID=1930071 RepID=A0A348AIH2_9FIRM|nr:DUF1015 family protein [Methylomusa anaerophila]BBB90870.1 hypothetical protein MAMMFC1_01537 [Methylomusa anaerophila]HML90663.1 DUF1015 family protein [Methylomusa anaerophila]
MAVVKPFSGLRPVPALAAKVASLPYDVMDSEEARQITRDNPYSFLRVTKSEVDLDPGIDVHSPVVYTKARENLEQFIRNQILVQDEKPCFYIYQQKMGQHIQVGLVAAASVEEYQQNIIKKHELTRPDKEQDRVNHIVATEAQTGAVFLTYKADETINSLINGCLQQQPAYDFTSDDGISHTLYVVDEPAKIAAIEQAFKKIDCLYIADGHHRSAAASRVCDLCRQGNKAHSGQEEYNTFQAVIFPHNMMYIMDYNRVMQDLNGLTPEQFLAAVQEKFTIIAQQGAFRPGQPHSFGMYLGGKWHQLVAGSGSFPEDNPVAKLDVSILQDNLLNPILGIQNPRTDKRIHFVGGIRGMEELERLVDSGKYTVAFSLFATSIEELMDIADAGEIMPPKSTWFEPKLRDAMVVHLVPCASYLNR